MKKYFIPILVLVFGFSAMSNLYAQNSSNESSSSDVSRTNVYTTLKIEMNLPPGISYTFNPRSHLHLDNKSDNSIQVSNRNYWHRAHGDLTIVDQLNKNKMICKYTVSLMNGHEAGTKVGSFPHNVLHADSNDKGYCYAQGDSSGYSQGTVSTTKVNNGVIKIKVEASP